MIERENYITREGLAQLEERLQFLLNVRREQVAERLKRATEEGGDLTENSEYIDAKNEQAFVEGEIVRVKQLVRTAKVIEKSKSDVAVIGSSVTVVEKGSKTKEVYQLVGPAEANPREGRVSHKSPLGAALLGSKKGNKVTVAAPDGDIEFKVVDVS